MRNHSADFVRTAAAALLGAAAALALAFVVVAILGAVAGVPVMFEPNRAEYGWEGAQDGMLWFVIIGATMVWPFPAIAIAGAAVGAIAWRVLCRRPNRANSRTALASGGH